MRKKIQQQLGKVGSVFILLGLSGLAYYFSLSEPAESLSSSAKGERIPCPVFQVFDGDTFSCDRNGDGFIQKPEEHVRLLGIDTPETHYSRKNKTGRDEPKAWEAQQFLVHSTQDQTVYLELDEVETDPYGRLLAYVYPDSESSVSINELLLVNGLAETLFYPPNVRYQEKFIQVERQAKEGKENL